MVVAWDPRGKTFRHREDPTYKANRSTTPDLLREQQPHFRPLMEAFGFVNTEVPTSRRTTCSARSRSAPRRRGSTW